MSCCFLLLRNNSQGSPTNAEATLDQHLELLLMCVRELLDAAVPYKLIAVFVWEFPSHSKVREMPSQGASRLRSWGHVALHHQRPPAVHNKDWLPHTAKKRQRDVWRVRFSTDNKNTRGSHQIVIGSDTSPALPAASEKSKKHCIGKVKEAHHSGIYLWPMFHFYYPQSN